jgi:ATP-dependent DNA helicase RecG
MHTSELSALIAQGESDTLELKKSSALMKEIVETVCAFANTHGGCIVVGARDDGAIVGQQISDDTLKHVANDIKLNTDPKVYPTVQKVMLNERSCLLITVEESPLRPHLAYGRPFVRVGASNQRLDRETYAAMLEQRYNGYGFDHLPLPEASLDDLDMDLLYRVIETANVARNANISVMLPPELILENLDLARQGVLTRAAILLFGKHPQRHFAHHFEIKCGLFADDVRFDNLLNDKEFAANLLDNFLLAYTFVTDALRTASAMRDEQRIDTLELPATVVREAIVNMIVHRDYRVDIKSTIAIRPHAITLSNPAHLFAPAITIEKLKRPHVSRSGNKLIAKIFYLLGYFENWGGGTLKIVEETCRAGKPEPEFRFQDGIFELMFFRDALAPRISGSVG